MNNQLVTKRQAILEKAKKKSELVIVKTNYLKNTPKTNYLGMFTGKHETELNKLCENVKVTPDTSSRDEGVTLKEVERKFNEANANCQSLFCDILDDRGKNTCWHNPNKKNRYNRKDGLEISDETIRKSECLGFLEGLDELIDCKHINHHQGKIINFVEDKKE